MVERARSSRIFRAAAWVVIGLVTTAMVACGGHSTASGSHSPTPGSHSPTATPQVSQGSKPLQDYTASQILEKVKVTMASVNSIRISGMNSGVLIDSFLEPPCKFSGTFQHSGISVRIIRIDSTVYLQANAAFFQKTLPAAAQRLAGQWVKTRADNAIISRAVPSRVAGCFHDLAKVWGGIPTQGIVKAGRRTVQGQPAIELLDPQNNAAYVAATGPPYLLAFAVQGGDYINFSRFNVPVTIEAPPNPVGF